MDVLAVLWLGAVLCNESEAGAGIGALFVAVFGGGALCLAWGLLAAVRLFRRLKGQPGAGMGGLWIVPALLALGVLGVLPEPAVHPLFRARFALSREAFTAKAAEALKAGTLPDQQRIGLFEVEHVSVYEGQVRFITTGCGLVDSCGVVYSPTGALSIRGEDRFTHLDGPWWHVYEGF